MPITNLIAQTVVDAIRGQLMAAIDTPLVADAQGQFQPISEDKLVSDYFQKGEALVVMVPGSRPSFVMMTKDGPDVQVNKAVFKAWANYQGVRANEVFLNRDPDPTRVEAFRYWNSDETRMMGWNERLDATVVHGGIPFDQPTQVVSWYQRQDPTVINLPSQPIPLLARRFHGLNLMRDLPVLLNRSTDKTFVGGMSFSSEARMGQGALNVFWQNQQKPGVNFLGPQGGLGDTPVLNRASLVYPENEPLSLERKGELLMASHGIIRDISGSNHPNWFMNIYNGLEYPLNVDQFMLAQGVTEAINGLSPLRDEIVRMEGRLFDPQNPPSADEKIVIKGNLETAYRQLDNHVGIVKKWIRYQGVRELADKFVTVFSKPLIIDQVNYSSNERDSFVGPIDLKLGPVTSVYCAVPEIGEDYTLGSDSANHGLNVTVRGGPEEKESLFRALEQKIRNDRPDLNLTFEREPGTDRLVVVHNYKNSLGEDASYRFFIAVRNSTGVPQGSAFQRFARDIGMSDDELKRAEKSGTASRHIWLHLVDSEEHSTLLDTLTSANQLITDHPDVFSTAEKKEDFRMGIIRTYAASLAGGTTDGQGTHSVERFVTSFIQRETTKSKERDALIDEARRMDEALRERMDKDREKLEVRK